MVKSYVLKRPLVLLGMMGAGKSLIGKKLSQALKVPFTDIDTAIEGDQNCKISEIFKYIGEAGFRELEYKTISKKLAEPPHVIATGGGAVTDEQTLNLLLSQAETIWLKADIGTLIERVSRRNTRPLLNQGNREEIMKSLYEKRLPLYEHAEHHIETSELKSPDDLVKKIIETVF